MEPMMDIPKVAKQGEGTQAKDVRATQEEILMYQVYSINSLLIDILEFTFHLVQSLSSLDQSQQLNVSHLRYKVKRDRYEQERDEVRYMVQTLQ